MIVITIIGCTNDVPKDLPKCYPCQITVVQDGAPLADATVTLLSPEMGQKWFPLGSTDQTGTANVLTNGRYHGAPEGTYKIRVYKAVKGASRFGPPPPEDSPDYQAWIERSGDEVIPEYLVVEPQYNDAQKTPHEIEVKKKGPNKITVDVGKPVKIRI